jgi:hypothetical protein
MWLTALHSGDVADELITREHALRQLPLPYSLALRLRDAGVAPDMVGEYLGIEEAALDGVLRIAEAKLAAAQQRTVDVCEASANDGRQDVVR